MSLFIILNRLRTDLEIIKNQNIAISTEALLIDKANLLNLSAPELTILVGGLRVIGTNYDDSKHGQFTDKPGQLNNDFFIILLDMDISWKATSPDQELYEGGDRKTGDVKWTATRADLVFGSNAELRALAEVYASQDAKDGLLIGVFCFGME